jgi:hypothetical protein
MTQFVTCSEGRFAYLSWGDEAAPLVAGKASNRGSRLVTYLLVTGSERPRILETAAGARTRLARSTRVAPSGGIALIASWIVADDKWLTPIRKAERYLAAQSQKWNATSDVYLQNVDFALLGLVAAGGRLADNRHLTILALLHV